MELEDIKSNVNEKWEETRASGLTGTVGRVLGGIAGILLLIIALLGFIWDRN
jgi:hypothetical protein